jgi:hypothetical protein
MIAAPGFVKQAKSAARSAGLEVLRVAEYPGAFASHTREELLANTRNILWPQIKKALTEALETRERADRSPMTDDSRLTGSYEELQRVFLDSAAFASASNFHT